jgi:hypothetical protein
MLLLRLSRVQGKSIAAEAAPTITPSDPSFTVGATSVAMLLPRRNEEHRG